jgi:hypothetical protein
MTSPDATVPSSARVYDYFLGGKTNYAPDREVADTWRAQFPEVVDAARANRGFTLRAARAMAETGITQIMDIGCGIPLHPNVHDVVRAVNPDTRVVYVDNDPTVLSYSLALRDKPGVITVEGDLRKPADIFTHPEVAGLLDLSRPVGVLTVAIWHFVPEDEAYDYQAQLREAMPPGSYLGLAHACLDSCTPAEVAAVEKLYKQTTTPVRARNRAAIMNLFDGFDLLEPGLVAPGDWRPRDGDPYPEREKKALAGVGVRR